MHILLLRHATVVLTYAGHRLLVDPMLGAKGSMPPAPGSLNPQRQPSVDLPLAPHALDELVASLTGIVLTHLHPDHWDPEAERRLPRNLPVICQPTDVAWLRETGFSDLRPVVETLTLDDLRITRVPARHGLGSIGEVMGTVSGYVLQNDHEPTTYAAGDTVWCPELQQTLQRFQPDVAVVNAGAARMINGGPVTMTGDDVCTTAMAVPGMRVVAVHMDGADLGTLSRAQLSKLVRERNLVHQIFIPADGEGLTFERDDFASR